jgi:hypothetical protein
MERKGRDGTAGGRKKRKENRLKLPHRKNRTEQNKGKKQPGEKEERILRDCESREGKSEIRGTLRLRDIA